LQRCLVDWLPCRSQGWLRGPSARWRRSQSVGWLPCRAPGWLRGQSVGWSPGWPPSLPVCWQWLWRTCWPGRIPNGHQGDRCARRAELARPEPRGTALPPHPASACGLGVLRPTALGPERRVAAAASGRRQAPANLGDWRPAPARRCCPCRLDRQRSGLPVTRPVDAEPRSGDRPAKRPRPARPRTAVPGVSARAWAAIRFLPGPELAPGPTAVRCPAAARVPMAVGRIPGRSARGVAGALPWTDDGCPSGSG
jgi:hypothetical protein